MPKDKPNNTPDIVEAKIDIQQYCKNEALKNKDELRDYFIQEYRHKTNKTNTIFSIILALLGLFIGIIGTNFIKDYISAKTKESMNQAITQSIDKYVQPKIDSAFTLPNIKSLVKTAAKENVDSIARPFILSQLEPYKYSLKKANIFALQTSAIAGNRKAYEELITLSKLNNSFSIDANNSIKAVVIAFNDYEDPIMSYPISRNGEEIAPDSIIKNIDLYFKLLKDPSTKKEERKTLIGYSLSFNAPDANKKEILRQCENILKQSQSMDICASACSILKRTVGNKAPFMDFDAWLKVIDEELKKR
ncbi:MAG: hypothetical protein RDU76_10610 [Candidatus Edwardsbacteria bacterium]|nr:hypothetical protein [Candidatus Edwardsbacteria bacterium]